MVWYGKESSVVYACGRRRKYDLRLALAIPSTRLTYCWSIGSITGLVQMSETMQDHSGVMTYTLALDDCCRGSHGEKNGRLHRASDVIEINQEVKKSVSGC
jgi:hypothetical protein